MRRIKTCVRWARDSFDRKSIRANLHEHIEIKMAGLRQREEFQQTLPPKRLKWD